MSKNNLDNLAYNILFNIDKVDIDDLSTILEHIGQSSAAIYEPYLKFALDYHAQFKVMPDRDYFNAKFNNILQIKPNEKFHKNFVAEFITIIEKQSTATLTHTAMIQGDFDKAYNIINKYKSSNIVTHKEVTMKDVIKNYRAFRDKFKYGLRLGIPELDEIFRFFAYKTLNVLVAPSANFKTTIASSIVYGGAFEQDLNIVYFTLEDTAETILFNLLSRFSYEISQPFSATELKRYMVTDDRMHLLEALEAEWDNRIKGKVSVLSAREVGSFTPMNIVKKLDEKQEEWGKIDVVVIDHFNIMNSPIPGLNLQGAALFSYYVRFMTNLSITYGDDGFILLGLSQANRGAKETLEKGKDMSTTQVADTSELERSATTMTSAYASPQHRAAGVVKLNIMKNRLGEQNKTVLVPIIPEFFKVGTSENDLQLTQQVENSKVHKVTDNLLNTILSSEQVAANLNSIGIGT